MVSLEPIKLGNEFAKKKKKKKKSGKKTKKLAFAALSSQISKGKMILIFVVVFQRVMVSFVILI